MKGEVQERRPHQLACEDKGYGEFVRSPGYTSGCPFIGLGHEQ